MDLKISTHQISTHLAIPRSYAHATGAPRLFLINGSLWHRNNYFAHLCQCPDTDPKHCQMGLQLSLIFLPDSHIND